MTENINYQDFNSDTFDRWVEEGWQWGIPLSQEAYQEALKGHWGVLLTPNKMVPHEWFGEMKGKKVLGLASGGGQQMPVFAALGAECTVFDYSLKQLESEKMVADREGYGINIVRGDMTQPLPFEDESFDLIFHPVSNSYIEKVEPVFQECYRLLGKGGILLSGLDIGTNYIVDESEQKIIHSLPFNPLTNPDQKQFLMDLDAGYQFSHTLAEQIGGQLKAGFHLTHLEEDTNSEGHLHDLNIPSFIMTRAVKL